MRPGGYIIADHVLLRGRVVAEGPRDDDTLAVVGMESLYVAGEGPGYAGGIASAAVDGLRVAHEMLKTWI